jgi:RNA polymerase sigma-70 factor (sigma-E family)
VGSADGEFEAFMAARYASLVRAARVLATEPAQAEDLVQTALTRTFSHWSTLRTTAAAEAYTHTTMARLAIRGRRRAWWRERASERLPEEPGTDEFTSYDDADEARRALASLPSDQRAVLVLRYYAQLSEAEIAWALRCPVGTVKSRASRALVALRESGLIGSTTDLLEARDD